LKKGVQTEICCPCGNEKILALGLCATCYTLKRQDAEYFGGLREQVLERDGFACRVCGDPDPGVHHREPGKSLLHLMIALCAGCHAKVHRTKVVLTEFPPLLLVLWREQPLLASWQYCFTASGSPRSHTSRSMECSLRKEVMSNCCDYPASR
jgi:hypothetical protein